jgi:hypothetical protein
MAKIKVGGGFGLVMLLIVVAVVLLVAGKAAKETAPIALQLNEPETLVNDHGQHEAADALSTLPNLNDARQSTDAHAEELRRALAEIE